MLMLMKISQHPVCPPWSCCFWSFSLPQGCSYWVGGLATIIPYPAHASSASCFQLLAGLRPSPTPHIAILHWWNAPAPEMITWARYVCSTESFQIGHQEEFFHIKDDWALDGLPGEVVESLSLGVYKKGLDVALSTVV